MIKFPNAKINIGLSITGKREDGFHSIESIFYPIPLFDILEIKPNQHDLFSTTGIKIEGDNLVNKAVQLLRTEYEVPPIFIHLHKQVPLGAGLGGGSADAANTILLLNELFKLGLDNNEMQRLAAHLGSDCPFFIENESKMVSGRGEIVQPSPLSLKGKYLKLIYPDIFISTAEAFANVKVSYREFGSSFSDYKNDFEAWAFDLHPELKDIKEQLKAEGAIYSAMSGSGSSIYGIYNERPEKSTFYSFEKIMLLK